MSLIQQRIAIFNSNPFLFARGMLAGMGQPDKNKTARYIVARNLARLMEGSTTLNTQEKVGKKAGVKQRTVGYLLDPETTDMKSPKLDTVEKVARAFGLEPWAMLVDPETFGHEVTRLLHRPATPDTRLVELGVRPLTESPPAVRGGKRGRRVRT